VVIPGDDGDSEPTLGPRGPASPGEHELTLSAVRGPGSSTLAATPVPREIGGYEVLGLLGEGGMGIVYEAEQRSPRRRVALKVIRGGQYVDDTRVKMFQREAETLARLRHPNIGAIYESGRTEDGQHFFAMELVQGKTLDAYLATRPARITSDELELRLRLFRTICDAVHYAHQRGVIHRDLKPGNIIVTDDVASTGGASSATGLPLVKVLDFGLARITDADVNAATILTEVGMIKGTLPYMSPEQARGDAQAIDVRTDVYALGVILYEMLAGTRPYDLARSALHEAVRVICEEPPKPLSHAWSGVRRLDADVETVVGTALAKEPERRYASAAALSEDVGRFLTSQPILARPPSAAYQLRKLFERHRASFGAAATALVALVAALAVSSAMYVRAEREAARARAAAAKSDQVAALLEEMLSGVGPSVALGRDTTMLREILDSAASRIGAGLAAQPGVEAEMRRVVAAAYRDLGEYETALRHAERALELHLQLAGPLDPATLRARHDLALVRYSLGDLEATETGLTTLLDEQRRVLGPGHPDTVQTTASLVEVLLYQNRLEEAAALGAPMLEVARRDLGATHETTLALLFSLAEVAGDLLDLERSEALFEELLRALDDLYGRDHPRALTARVSYGWVLRLGKRYAEAETVTRAALESMRRVLGNDHDQTLVAVNNLGIILKDQGRFEEAEPYYLENVESGRRVLGDRHPEQLASVVNLAAFYVAQGRYAEAEPLATASAALLAEEVSPDFVGRGFALQAAGNCRLHLGRLEAASGDLEEAHRILSPRFGPEHPKMAELLRMLAEVSERRGLTDDAARWRALLDDAA